MILYSIALYGYFTPFLLYCYENVDTPNLPPVAPSISAQPVARDAHDVEQNKDLAAFSYTWIMSVFMLLLKHKSPFVHFHARQATVLFVLSIAFWFIPYVGRFLEVFIFIGFAWGFFNAAQGKWDEVPFVGPLARGKISLRQSWKLVVAACVHALHDVKGIWHKHDHHTHAPVSPVAPPVPHSAPHQTPPTAAHETPLSP